MKALLAFGFGLVLGWYVQPQLKQQWRQVAQSLKKAPEQLPEDGPFKDALGVNTQQLHDVLREFRHPPDPPFRIGPLRWEGLLVQVTLIDGTVYEGRITSVWSSQMRVNIYLDNGTSLLGLPHESSMCLPCWRPIGWEAVNHNDFNP